jgi:hypothetical protein
MKAFRFNKGTSAYYASVTAALAATTAPTSGDFIMCSSVHDHSPATAIAWTLPDGVTVISVSDTNCDQYLAGAKESADNLSVTLDFEIKNAAIGQYNAVIGMTIESENTIQVRGTGMLWYFRDCTFNFLNAHAAQTLTTTGLADGAATFHNCVLNFDHIGSVSSGSILITDGPTLEFVGLTSTGTAVTTFLEFGTGGGRAIFRHCNLAQLIATSGNLLDDIVATDDSAYLVVDSCKLPTSMTRFRSTPTLPNHHVTITASGSADEYYSYFNQSNFSTAEEDTVQYLTATYDGTNEFSTKITTDSTVSLGFPYKHHLVTLPAQNLSSGKTYTVELVSSDSGLTDVDVWVEIAFQDGTDQALGTLVDTRNSDFFAAGAALTTSSAVWATETNTEYKISASTGAQTGATNSNVEVYVYVAKPSIVVNFGPAVTVT